MHKDPNQDKSPMEKHYDKNYFFAERFGGKKYIDSAGKEKEFGYHAGGLWNFQGILDKLLELLGTPESVLDIGAGCGGFTATINQNFIPSVGLEFSQYAIDHAILGGEKYLVRWDLEETPWPVRQHDWVTAIDLFEHLFADKVDHVIAEMKRKARRWIVAKICTAKMLNEVWVADRAPYEEVIEQAKREGFEWLVVSGHVNSRLPQYWLERFEDDDWRQREDLANRIRQNLKLPDDWRTTLILEDQNWFEKEFGR